MFSSDGSAAAHFSDTVTAASAEERLASSFRNARILIVDDELANVRILERLITRAGLENFRSTTDSRQAIPLLREFAPDILLLDLHMPYMDGFAVMQKCRDVLPHDTFLPIVVLTADATSETKLRALENGATDFLTKPLDHAEVLLRLRNLLHTRRLHCELEAQNTHLEETVCERTADLRKALGELQDMQGHLVQQERLSAFGTMASGVAHDFNNALSIILGYSEILLADDGRLGHAERQEYVRTVITAAKDSASMVDRLREFYRPNDNKEVLEHVDFGQLVREAVSLTEPKWKGKGERRGRAVDIKFDVLPVPPVSGNAAELRELLTNLIFNAVDAMPDGGSITLRVQPRDGKVVVEVTDTGLGMSEEVRLRCLEPFFTTKGDKGTGLGLAMVYGIVQRHHADMQLESTPGVGTTFRFTFAAENNVEETGEITEVQLARPLRILVVDDQPFICEIMEQYLAQDCHFTVTAECGEEALCLLRQQIFDVLITDQSMPDITGGELAVQAREIDPRLRVILLTGFGSDERPEEGADAIDLVLGKPVALEKLRQALAEVTSRTPAAVLTCSAAS